MRQVILLLFCLSFTTCQKGHRLDCVKTAGKVVTETFSLENFTKINVADKIDLELVYTPLESPSLEITYNENLIHGIKRDVKDGELILRDDNTCNWVRSFDLQPRLRLFYNDSLRDLLINGSAKVYNKDTMRIRLLFVTHLGLEDLELTTWGVYGIECNAYNSGGFKFKGFVGYIASTLDDIATLDISELLLDDLYLFQYSLRDAKVRSRVIMDIKLYGRGNVIIIETPSDTSRHRCCQVNLEKIGPGNFIQ